MKRSYHIVFILCLMSLCAANRADAQFWKRWSKKNRHPKVDSAAIKKDILIAKKKKKEINYPVSQFKNRYRIDLLAALYLDELVPGNKQLNNDKIPEKAQSGLEFYKGMKLAADTLNKLNYFIDLYVNDISDPVKGIDKLAAGGELSNSDLIIGVLPSKDLPHIANFAKSKKINFISALSPSDGGVKDNPYFTLLQPSLESHCERIKEVLAKRYAKKTVHLFYRSTVAVDETAYHFLDAGDKAVNFNKVNFEKDHNRDELKRMFDSTQVNVIVMAFFDIAYSEKLLNQLSGDFPDYKFEVYGMPSWKSMSKIHKKDAYANIVIDISVPFYFEQNLKQMHYVERMYKKQFGGKPGELVFRGYEAMFWYADLLKKYGNVFNPKMSDNSQSAFTKFEVKPKWDKNSDLFYNENRHVYLYKYQKGAHTVE